MTKPRVSIIGLGLIGGSIGLGLAANTKDIHILGHDIDPSRGRLAKKMGAVHESHMNLVKACQDADVVIIATPITAIRETLELIAPHLRQGCVITDTATLKEPVLAWAAETLPAGVPFVGGDPMLNPNAPSNDMTAPQGLEHASADLFHNALYALCPGNKTPPAAVKRVSDMINLLKARPLYMDPIEHDGMRAAVEGLPALTGLALMQEVSGAPGWKETRKLADHAFGMATASLAGDIEAQRAFFLLNADYLLPRIDAFIHTLAQLRDKIAAQDASALEKVFERASSARAHWLIDRAGGDWEQDLMELSPTNAVGSLSSLLGLGAGRRKPKED
jgi:prephenate dehydrogenase